MLEAREFVYLVMDIFSFFVVLFPPERERVARMQVFYVVLSAVFICLYIVERQTDDVEKKNKNKNKKSFSQSVMNFFNPFNRSLACSSTLSSLQMAKRSQSWPRWAFSGV